MLNDLKIVRQLARKAFSDELIANFTNTEPVATISKRFNITCKYPQATKTTLKEFLIFDNFTKILAENNIEFPLVIKYTGNTSFYKHLTSIIFDISAFDDWATYFANEDQTGVEIVVQHFINHGGKIFKMYRINQQNYVDIRSSIPDVTETLKLRFEEGFWNFKTIELESPDFKNRFKDLQKSREAMQKLDLQAVNLLTEEFEHFSGLTLFGLDYMYNQSAKTFYLIDCNSLPSYKVDIDKPEKFRSHALLFNKIINNSSNNV